MKTIHNPPAVKTMSDWEVCEVWNWTFSHEDEDDDKFHERKEKEREKGEFVCLWVREFGRVYSTLLYRCVYVVWEKGKGN